MKKTINIWFSRLTNDDKNILKHSLFISLILSIVITLVSIFISWWHYSWGIFILIGNFISCICYIKLANNITNMLKGYYQNYKRKVVLNYLTSLLLYFVVLTISVFVNTYAIFGCIIGIFILKIIIYIKNIKK